MVFKYSNQCKCCTPPPVTLWSPGSGVSPHNRGDVWSFLVKQKLSSLEGQEPVSAIDGLTLPEYQEMKSGTTDYEQVIRMDLGMELGGLWSAAV